MLVSLFTYANAAMILLFLAAVALQYNDPDPLRWMAIYGSAAACCVYGYRERASWVPAAVVGGVSLVWALILAPDALSGAPFADIAKEMKAADPGVELLRELLGLVIVSSWMAVLVVVAKKRAQVPGT